MFINLNVSTFYHQKPCLLNMVGKLNLENYDSKSDFDWVLS
jgi:hypothetical protein